MMDALNMMNIYVENMKQLYEENKESLSYSNSDSDKQEKRYLKQR